MNIPHPETKGMAHTRTGNITRILSLNIARKILFGYLVLAAFTIALGILSLSTLNRINNINTSIIEVDTRIVASTELLIETLLSQETYGRRYVILKTPEMLNLFWERSVEFKQEITRLKDISPSDTPEIDEIISLHSGYAEVFHTSFAALMRHSTEKAIKLDEDIKARQEEILDKIDVISARAHHNQGNKTMKVANLGLKAFRISIVLCSLALLTGITAAAMITKGISESIGILKEATRKIANGDFHEIPSINRNDELGDLSKAFVEMAVRIKHLEEMYLDASPLTHLPGGIAIENVLKKRIASGQAFAFCLLDLDNFKAFNDYYGYAKGSDLIIAVADLIEAITKEKGSEDDFLGHIGGDDFALITDPRHATRLCKSIIKRFDEEVPLLYASEDREQGYILGETRQGEEARFPIVTISIAVVTNQSRVLSSHLEVGEIVAELKEYAKSIDGSVFVVDHRRKEQRSA